MTATAIRWGKPYAAVALQAFAAAIVCAGLWLSLASLVFLWATNRLATTAIPAWHRPMAWWFYLSLFGWRHVFDSLYLILAAVIASTPFVGYVRWRFTTNGGWRGLRQGALGIGRLARGTSDNHGHADWMTMKRAQERFPPIPHPEIGGIVVGEADRVDLGPGAGISYNPDNPETWGNGGRSPLLIDHCRKGGPVHSIVMAGTGVSKTASLATTCLTWRKSMVVLDPSTEIGPMLADAITEGGRRVIQIGIGDIGFNVLKAIDITNPLAETKVRSVVGRIVGPIQSGGKSDSTAAEFREWGKSIITALLAHMMWDPDISEEDKTLDTLRDGLCIPEAMMRDVLRGIYERSHSRLARHMASNMMDMTDVTFSGALGNATRDTAWLSTAAYSDLVSGDAFDARDICAGNVAVFVQIPLEALVETPAIARVIIGSLIDTVISADGQVDGEILFAPDEAVLLGAMTALLIARDQGRKYGIVLHMLYQSEGQLEEIWGKAGKEAWFDACAWRAYAGVKSINTARDLSTALGTYGVRAYSRGHNSGRSGRILEIASRSHGSNENEHEINRELAKPAEILSDFRTDERIVIVSGNEKPLRCGTAIGFRRPEIAMKLKDNRFVT